MTAHATIEGADGRLQDWRDLEGAAAATAGVSASAPYITGQGLLVNAARFSGVEIRGIDPALETTVSGLSGLMREGSTASLTPRSYQIVLGVDLADALGVGPGDKVVLIIADGIVTPAGIIPRTRSFTVSGIYRAGMYEFDRRLALINIDDAARLYRFGGDVSGVRLQVDDIYSAPTVVRDAATAIGGGVRVSDWTRRHSAFFRSIQVTKSILFVILSLVVAVAAFNIVSTLVMVVNDKRQDIAILRTAGATPKSVMSIFVWQGALIGVIGTAAGLALGIVLALNLERLIAIVESAFGIKLLAADVYFISDLPSELLLRDIVNVGGIAVALSLVSTLYPSWRAANTPPADSLRYD